MKMIKKRGKKLVSAIILAFLAVYALNVGFFVHTHIIDGKYVSHSHFYGGTSDTPAHSHTPLQLRAIDFLSHLLMAGVSAIVLLLFGQKWQIVNTVQLSTITKTVPRFYNLRAPPFN